MIAKTPDKRSDNKSSFRTLKEYIANREVVNELTGEIELREVVIETNCISLKTASAEMKAIADMNGRVKDPVYHTVLSWQPGENPTDEQMFEAGRAAIAAIGMEGHQYVTAIHRDTDKAHVHIMVNRVHPETERTVYPDRDFYKLDKCMREIELKQGWTHTNGAYSVQEVDGEKVIDWASKDKNTKGKLPTKAKDFEAKTGNESLHSYARRTARNDVFQLLKEPGAKWQDLHARLAVHGLEIKEKGQGLGIYSKSDSPDLKLEDRPHIKASDLHENLGKGRLEKQLGAFEPPSRNIQNNKPTPQHSYSKNREVQSRERTPEQQAKRDAQREDRAQARAELKARYEAYKVGRQASSKKDNQSERAKALQSAQARKQITASGLSPAAKTALRSVAAFDAARERERIKADLAAERKAHKPESFKEWTERQATAGDAAAIAQLNGWAYQDKKKAAELEKAAQAAAEQGAIAPKTPNQEPPAPPGRALEGVSWEVNNRLGEVAYHRNGLEIFRDRGTQIGISKAGETDRESIAAALLVARQKFGDELTLTGSEKFKKLAVEVMVQNGITAKITDPNLETYRQQLIKEKQNGNQRNHQQKQTDARPPAHLRDWLHHLSDGDLVLDTERDVGLLQGHVLDCVEQPEKGIDHGLQREEPGDSRRSGAINQLPDTVVAALESGDKEALASVVAQLKQEATDAASMDINSRPIAWAQVEKFRLQGLENEAAERVNAELQADVQKYGLAVPTGSMADQWAIAERSVRQDLEAHERTSKPTFGRGEWVATQEKLRQELLQAQQRIEKRDALLARERAHFPDKLRELEKRHHQNEAENVKKNAAAIKQLERIKPIQELVRAKQLELGHVREISKERVLSR